MKLPFSLRHSVLLLGAALFLGGCALTPTPYTKDEITSINTLDRQAALSGMPELKGSLTQEEAIARALKFNLEHRIRILEQSLASGQMDLSRFDVLPKLMANAGYNVRNEDLTRNAIDSVTGAPSLSNPFISSDRKHTTSDLTFSWSLLDFGASYYSAQQNADRVLIANERRRKVMHTLIQNVRTAFSRVVAAEKLQTQVRETIQEAEGALEDSRKIESERIKSPIDALRYQRSLLENLRLLENVDRELSVARIELASLIGILPGTPYKVAEPDLEEFKILPLDMPVERMEEIALNNNADLREQFYNARIAATETRKTLLKLFPGISFDYGVKHDNDAYLIHQTWNEASLRVGFNLFNLLSAPAQMDVANMNSNIAETRRMALQMAVLSQVHLSRQQYEDALLQYKRADSIWDVDKRLAQFTRDREASQMASQLDRVSANVSAILSQLRLYHALAKVYEASSKLHATLGLEPQIGSLDDTSLTALTLNISDALQQGMNTDQGVSISKP